MFHIHIFIYTHGSSTILFYIFPSTINKVSCHAQGSNMLPSGHQRKNKWSTRKKCWWWPYQATMISWSIYLASTSCDSSSIYIIMISKIGDNLLLYLHKITWCNKLIRYDFTKNLFEDMAIWEWSILLTLFICYDYI